MSNRKKRKATKGFDKETIKNHLIPIFAAKGQKSYNYKQLASKLLIVDSSTRELLSKVLDEMKEEGVITEERKGKFKYNASEGIIEGKVDLSEKSYPLVYPLTEDDEPIFVSMKNLRHSLHGDIVKVQLYAKRKDFYQEGEVIEIIKRSGTQFVGTIELTGSFGFFNPETKTMPKDIFIPFENLNGAEHGQKVTVEICEWPAKARSPIGKVIKVLGNRGEHEVEMHAVMATYNLPFEFEERVIKAAERIKDEISKKEIEKRIDFRNTTTFTIDPFDAKDFDDALSVKKLESGLFEVGVHIADVTHYVNKDTVLDTEAFERATSVYLVDRVVPMLPERLSNFICSLRPNEEKLCFSVIFTMDEDANVIDYKPARTIINSDRRYTYEEAQSIIEGSEDRYKDEVLTLHKLAQKLRQDRFKDGAIAFEKEEVKFKIDDKGVIEGVYLKQYKDSNKLVEEFMLLANKKIAEFIGKKERNKKEKTFVYRIHDKPNPEKLKQFSTFIARFGYEIKKSNDKALSKSINLVLEKAKGSNEQTLIETLAVRSMAKAEYSTQNIGHYGLAFKHYTHFTSPIRRYPDMMVHRILAHYLEGGSSVSKFKYEEACKHSSDREQRAVQAERASVKYKQVEYMSDKIGRIYKGIISGVTEWGVYVELLDSKCEGMVSIRDMKDDRYFFDEKNFCIIGRRTKKKYQLGDPVQVEVTKANLFKRQLDFRFPGF